MSSNGECFIVIQDDTVFYGRNSVSEDESGEEKSAQEIQYYDTSESAIGKVADDTKTFRVILQKPKVGIWGADCGANERNVAIGLSWTSKSDDYSPAEMVRCALAIADSAENAVDHIGSLVEANDNNNDDLQANFIIADTSHVWLLSCSGKLWAAQCVRGRFLRVPGNGLAVGKDIEKSSTGMGDALKEKGLWDGESDLDFAKCFNVTINSSESSWCDDDEAFTVTSMFKTLRAATTEHSRSSAVFVLKAEGIGCHWFTGTPCANESVFKPFVFAPQPRISPLTKVPSDQNDDDTETLLHKLHSQRKAAAVDALRLLEAACVIEVNGYIAAHQNADEELDDLLKDCVEAEVKFYR